MRIVTWTDPDGYVRRALLRAEDPDTDAPRIGIPLCPPSLEELPVSEEVKRDLHNHIMARNLLTWADVVVQQAGLTACAHLVGREHKMDPRQVSELRRQLIAVYKNSRR